MLIKKPAPWLDDWITERHDPEEFWGVLVIGGVFASFVIGLVVTVAMAIIGGLFGLYVSPMPIVYIGFLLTTTWYAYIFTFRYCKYNRLDFDNQRIIDAYMSLPKSNRKDFTGLYELASNNNATWNNCHTFTQIVQELNRRNTLSDAKQQAMRDRQSAVQQMLEQELDITRQINKDML